MVSSKPTMAAGASPKVMSSASESSSLPIGDDTWSSRALMPSKKSKAAPITIHRSAMSTLPEKAWNVAIHPAMRLQDVSVLGIIFLMVCNMVVSVL